MGIYKFYSFLFWFSCFVKIRFFTIRRVFINLLSYRQNIFWRQISHFYGVGIIFHSLKQKMMIRKYKFIFSSYFNLPVFIRFCLFNNKAFIHKHVFFADEIFFWRQIFHFYGIGIILIALKLKNDYKNKRLQIQFSHQVSTIFQYVYVKYEKKDKTICKDMKQCVNMHRYT